MKKIKQIEIIKKPEYANLVITDIQLHGNKARKPKEWYPELLYNSRLQQGARIFTDRSNISIHEMPKGGVILESRFPVDTKTADLYKQALTSRKKFKIYVPKNGIKILYHESLKERIRAYNRGIGFEKYKIIDGYGKLSTFDIIEGMAIIRVVIK